MSLVLVITPIFSCPKNPRLPLLLQSIYWVRRQTHRDYLHVIVDDGSTDETADVLAQIQRGDPRLLVLRKDNSGSSAAINFGLEQALESIQPDYVAVCHSDDVMTPDSLEVRVRLARENQADFVYSDEVTIFDTDRRPRYRHAHYYNSVEELHFALLNHRGIPYTTMMWQAELFHRELKGFDARLTSAEDWDIAIRTAGALVASGSLHASIQHATMLRREHQFGLRAQNLRDGTKKRCYEIILGKHFEGEKLQAAMNKELTTRLKSPTTMERVQSRLFRSLGPEFLKHFHHAAQLFLPPKEMPPYARTFLQEWRNVDYESPDTWLF